MPLDPSTPAPDGHTAAPASPSTQLAPAATTPAPLITQLASVTVKRGDTLWDIAEHHLGDPLRYTEIRDLNLGRTQPDGRQLRDADWILPGWVLLLPADAADVEHAVPVGHAPPAAAIGMADDVTVVVKPGDTLWDIAAEHLGDGHRYPEIADLSRGVTQNDGGHLTDPDLIRPGWVLRLPHGTTTVAEPPPRSDDIATVEPAEPTTNATTVTPSPSQPTVVPHEAAALPAAEATPTLQATDNDAAMIDDLDDEAGSARAAATWLLGFAALGAVGIVGEIARRRHLQQRARKVGETIPLPEPGSPAAAAERTLRTATTPVSIDAIRTTLTNLAHRCFDTGHDLPRIGALLLDEHHLTLVLVDDAPDPVAPFTATDPRTWVAATADIARDYSEAIALARLGWAALAVGTSHAVLDYVIPYVKEREAFGEPIARRQAVAFMCANIAIELDGLRLISWRGAARAEQGLPFAREAALAKKLGSDKAVQIGLDGVQLLGGHGYTREHPVERWYRDLRVIGLAEGVVVL